MNICYSADFTPALGNYHDLSPFRMWCQKVIPLVYDDSLSYYEVLCKLVNYLNVMLQNVETLAGDVNALHAAYIQLQDYVNQYFDNLDVQEEINNKLDEMAANGELTELLLPLLPPIIDKWLQDNITPTSPPLDDSFTLENAAAQSKATGETFYRYRGSLKGDFKNALIGTYAFNKSEVTGLPDISAQYGWLICVRPTQLYVCIEDNQYRKTWIYSGNNWSQNIDTSLTLRGIPADSYSVGEKNFSYRGALTGNVTNAKIGVYAVNKNEVPGLPKSAPTYNYLICLVPNSIYILIEDNIYRKIWLYRNGVWVPTTDSTFSIQYLAADSKATGEKFFNYRGGGISGDFKNTLVGSYAINSSEVTGLPENANSKYGWLTCIIPNQLYLYVENSYTTPIHIYQSGHWMTLNKPIEMKKITFIGDSITEQNQTSSSNYVRLLALNDVVDTQNMGLSGSGFARLRETNNNYVNRITNIRQGTNLLCVSGSFNDMDSGLEIGNPSDTELNTICGFINNFFDTLDEEFPSLPVLCYTLNYWRTQVKHLYVKYVDSLAEICKQRAIPFVPITYMCNIRPWVAENEAAYIYNRDGTHPNDSGQKLIYEAIRDYVIRYAR